MKTKAGIVICILGAVILSLPVTAFTAQDKGLTVTSVTVHKLVRKSKASGLPKFTMDFNNVDIKDFIKVISKITGKDFILSRNVSGKVTIISPTPVTLKESWKIFESVLKVNQLTTVGTGNVIKIISLRNVKGTNINTYIGRSSERTSDVYITQVIPLHYIAANEMANVLRSLLSPFGNIQAYNPTNTLIITESASNINRLLKIIRELDTNIYSQIIQVIKLKYATAQSIAGIINSLYAGRKTSRTVRFFRPTKQSGQVQQPIKVLYDDRTNSLILVASLDEITSIKELIKKLDVPVRGEGQIHVYYLKNANAKKLASTLASLTGRANALTGRRAPRGPAVARLAGGVKITADPSTNSLIIVASPQDYQTIKKVIQRLDIRRRQVYVQAVIAELSLNGTRQLGVDLNAIPNLYANGANVGATSNMGAGSTTLPSAKSPLGPFGLAGLSIGLINGTITLNGVTYPNIIGFINALETSSQANVLSTPNILATDNEPAEIMVGQNIPMPTGRAMGRISGYSQTFVRRQDVGLKLKITPQINAGNYIRMKISFQLTSIIPSPQGLNVNTLGITTSKREAKTVVTVKDRSTIVIGGLLENKSTVSESKIPFLGDLPIIGWLFRSSNKTKNKTDLMIFITPYIIKDQSDIAEINRMKKAQSDKFEKQTFGYKLKNSPFTQIFNGMNITPQTTSNSPKPLLFTGETYITPKGIFHAQTSSRKTAAAVTSATAGATPSGSAFTTPVSGNLITGSTLKSFTTTTKGVRQIRSTTDGKSFTNSTPASETAKPVETPIKKQ